MGEGRGSRRQWTEEEKRQIVAKARIPGMTVAEVARRYEVNTSLVFIWRRDPRPGAEDTPEPRPSFVPVVVAPAQLSMLLEGLDWRALRRTWRSLVVG